VTESLASIDFGDFEPPLIQSRFAGGDVKSRPLVTDPLFSVEALEAKAGTGLSLKPLKLQIIAAVRGQLEIKSGSVSVDLAAGQFCLVPAGLEQTKISATSHATCLRVEAN
jgi:mannose-6-phosphate isomerase class I